MAVGPIPSRLIARARAIIVGLMTRGRPPPRGAMLRPAVVRAWRSAELSSARVASTWAVAVPSGPLVDTSWSRKTTSAPRAVMVSTISTR